MSQTINLVINNSAARVDVDPDKPLLHVLREDLGLTGSKIGCGEGECGACTVLIDGEPTRSCITPIGMVDGKNVRTIEGIARDGQLHSLQEAFLAVDALQCGYCTSGMIVSGVALLERFPDPSEDEIVQYMQGNLCRCGTYRRIIQAIRQAAQVMRAASPTGGE